MEPWAATSHMGFCQGDPWYCICLYRPHGAPTVCPMLGHGIEKRARLSVLGDRLGVTVGGLVRSLPGEEPPESRCYLRRGLLSASQGHSRWP